MAGARNVYGCTPCPKCGGRYRYPLKEDGSFPVIACDDCGRRGAWSGEWGEDGYSADEAGIVIHQPTTACVACGGGVCRVFGWQAGRSA
jgi:hypothetical protein